MTTVADLDRVLGPVQPDVDVTQGDKPVQTASGSVILYRRTQVDYTSEETLPVLVERMTEYPMENAERAARCIDMVTVSPSGAIVHSHGYQVVGIGWKSGKAYVRTAWKEIDTQRKTASGRLVHTSRSSKGRFSQRRDRAFGPGRVPLPVSHLVVEMLGDITQLADAYPLAREYGISPNRCVSGFLDAFEGTTTAAQLTARLFGSRRIRRDLVKAVAKCRDADALYVAWCLRGPDVPIDWTVDFLRRHEQSRERVQNLVRHVKGLRGIVRHLDVGSRRRLLRSDLDHGTRRTIMDIDIQASRLRNREMKPITITTAHGWHGLEDQVREHYDVQLRELREASEARSRRQDAQLAKWYRTDEGQAWLAARDERERRRIEEEEQRRIEREKVLRAQQAARFECAEDVVAILKQFDDVTVADNQLTLSRWSDTMENCVRNYGRKMEDRTAVLFTVRDGDDMVACGEVRIRDNGSSELVQLLGYRNRTWPGAQDMAQSLAAAGIPTSNSCILVGRNG